MLAVHLVIPAGVPGSHSGLGPALTHVAAPCPPGIVPATSLPPPPQEMLSPTPQWSAHSLRTRSGRLSPLGHSEAPLSPLSGRGPKAFSTWQVDEGLKPQCQLPAFNAGPRSKPHLLETGPAPPPKSPGGIPPVIGHCCPGESSAMKGFEG